MGSRYGAQWDAEFGEGNSGDSPKTHSNIAAVDGDGGGVVWIEVNAAESFETWLMYRPPAVGTQGTAWVPLQDWNWSWSGDMTAKGAKW